MKKWMTALLVFVLLPVLALAEGSVLMVELEQDAQMVENVAFEDGDFIQTYQLSGGASVQLVRYASFDMTLGDLIASEWVGATDVRELGVQEISGCPVQGLRFAYQEEGQEALDVTLAVVDAGETLVFTAVYPQALGAAQIDAAVQAMLSSMSVTNEGAETADPMAEVG
ncbi:MAG: hypothetical protein E7321_05220 [Clostridiales bacterium]|nr:hypothetical protein [Clostridiales bacterium]